MAKQDILMGVTDRSVLVFIPDPASTDGSGKTGLVAANLTVSYTRVETDNDVVLVDATSSLNNLAALTTAHTDWGLLEVSNTLAPGLYRLDIADAVFASGAWAAVVYVMITTSAAAASPMEFILVAYNPLDAVRLGLTALPNAAADAAGGLPISDAGGLDLDTKLANTNEVTVARMGALTDWINGGRLDLILDIIAADTTTDLPALIATLQGFVDTEVAAIKTVVDAVQAKTDNLPSDPADASVVAGLIAAVEAKVDIIDTNVDDVETAVITNAAGVDIAADIIAIKAETASVQGDTNDIQARLPAALTGDGNIKADTLRVGGTLQTAGDIPVLIVTVDDLLDTEVGAIKTDTAAIKVQTDKLAFTVANQVDANMLRIEGTDATDVLATLDDAVLAAIAALNNLAAGASMALTAGAVDAIFDEVYEGTETLRQLLRLMRSTLAGKLDGAATTTVHTRDIADTKNRVTATVDADGNRSAVTVDVS